MLFEGEAYREKHRQASNNQPLMLWAALFYDKQRDRVKKDYRPENREQTDSLLAVKVGFDLVDQRT